MGEGIVEGERELLRGEGIVEGERDLLRGRGNC